MTVRPGAELVTPWPLRSSPYVDRARSAAIDWMRSFGLMRDEHSVREFTDRRLAEAAGFFYPDAGAVDSAVAAQLMGWCFLPFDDRPGASRHSGLSPDVCGRLVAVVHGESAGRPGSRSVVAFEDLWRRMTRGMSASLLARLRRHWSSYFSSRLSGAVDRRPRRTFTDLDAYFSLRAATTCALGQNDLAEHWGGTEVPPALWHHPLPARMRGLVADLVARRADGTGPHACGRGDAAQRTVDRLVVLEETALPRLARRLDPGHRTALRGYADILHNRIVGDHEWRRLVTPADP
ncbi:terpene synthase family protein [Nonomuraea longicatena]|uniref:Terpene synthase n=1 Tax=Nonomuraea longicatena TaxID=83682 RepID=A0ABP4A5J5_9ACTN